MRYQLVIIAALTFFTFPSLVKAEGKDETLPKDISQFIERVESCVHWRGEPWIEDQNRRDEITKNVDLSCPGLDKQFNNLSKKYEKQGELLKKINSTDKPWLD